MAGIAGHLLEFPPEGLLSEGQYHNRALNFIDSLVKLDTQKIIKADAQQDLLQVLNPAVNSIAFLYILTLRHRTFFQSRPQSTSDARTLLSQALNFLHQFDPIQLRYAGGYLRQLINDTLELAHNLQQLSQVVNPIIAAIFRVDSTSGTLTSTHIRLLRLCLDQRMYREALPILQATIHSFPAPRPSKVDGQFICSPHTDSSAYITEDSGLSDRLGAYDVHEYFLLGGMINIALQQWEEARLYLECVLVSPSQGSASMSQVEAYKKWALVCCILKGQTPEAPKAANQTMLRTTRTIGKAYDTIVEVFQSGNSQRLQAEITQGQPMWFDDGNLGLILLLQTRLPRFQILHLQDTYSAIPLITVSNWLHITPDDLQVFISDMVSEGALNAEIDGSGAEPVLRFFSNQSKGPLAKTEKEYHSDLIRQTKRTNAMAEYVKMSDRRLTLMKEYIDAVRKRARNQEDKGMAATGKPLDDPTQLDEDIMMDE